MFKRWIGKYKPDEIQGEDIAIGVIASRSGPTAAYSEMAVRGFGMAIEYGTKGTWKVGDRLIRLLIEDDDNNPDIGMEKAHKLLKQDNVHILQGCTSSAVTARLVHDLDELDRLLMVAVAATDVVTGEWRSRYVFRTASSTSQDAAAGAKYAVEHLGKRFYLFSPDFLWGHQSRAAWWHVIEQYGGIVTGDLMASPTETNFRPYLSDILAAKPDVLVPSWVGPNTKHLLMQMQEMGIMDSIKVAGGLVEREILEHVGDAVAGMVCSVKYHHAFPKNPVNHWLVSRHQERFGAPPDLFTESGFSSGVALIEGLRRTRGNTDAESLIPVLEGMNFFGPKGVYTFRPEDHQALQPMYIAKLVTIPGQRTCAPLMIKEVSDQESAPPITPLRS
jgi:branched-chain amino acid transport system substrate-binding protein